MNSIGVAPWGAVELLVEAASSGRRQVEDVIARLGLASVTGAVIDELVLRGEHSRIGTPVLISLVVSWRGERVDRVLAVDVSGIRACDSAPDQCAARIQLDAVDLLEALFSADGRFHCSSREVAWSGALASSVMARPNGVAPNDLPEWAAATDAVHVVLAAANGDSSSLRELSVRSGADKWANFHWYAPHYELHFERRRPRPVRLLEIGIGGYDDPDKGGASLRMWQRYFPRGLTYGLDIVDKRRVDGPRVRVIRGDQSDGRFLDRLGRELGPFDIVIDDGSHVNEHVRTSFTNLFPHVRLGGIYAIEDLMTSYNPASGGSRDVSRATTSTAMLKSMIDGLHHQELGPDRGGSYADRHVVGLHVYNGLAIVEKGRNLDAPVWNSATPVSP